MCLPGGIERTVLVCESNTLNLRLQRHRGLRLGLRPLACCHFGFEFRLGHGRLFPMSVICRAGIVLDVCLITHIEEFYRVCCAQLLRPRIRVREGHSPSSDISATEKNA